MRVFIGYKLTKMSCNQLEKWQCESGLSSTAKFVLPKNFHLTLLCNGELTPEQLEKYLEKLHKQQWEKYEECQILGLTTFTKKNQHIIVAEVENTPALQANREYIRSISEELKLPFSDEYNWKPHITLARQKDEKIEKKFQKKFKMTNLSLIVFTSNSSFTGISYEAIAEL